MAVFEKLPDGPSPSAAPTEVAPATRTTAPVAAPTPPSKVSVRGLNFFYGTHQALRSNNIEIAANRVTAIIGPSGCGKSTHIRVYNRIYELYRDQRAEGEVLLDGKNLLDPSTTDVLELRKRVGMIFQKPTPFPMSVFDNVAYGLRLHNRISRSELVDRVKTPCAALRCGKRFATDDKPAWLCPAVSSSVCALARAIAVEPDVLLMDEPSSAIDPVGTAKIEDLIDTLRENFTIIIVTHNMQQAARVSDYTACFSTRAHRPSSIPPSRSSPIRPKSKRRTISPAGSVRRHEPPGVCHVASPATPD